MYKQILIHAKFQTGRRGQKAELPWRSPRRRRRSALDCSVIEEEEEEEEVVVVVVLFCGKIKFLLPIAHSRDTKTTRKI